MAPHTPWGTSLLLLDLHLTHPGGLRDLRQATAPHTPRGTSQLLLVLHLTHPGGLRDLRQATAPHTPSTGELGNYSNPGTSRTQGLSGLL
jgi:hypothetical protein